LNARKKRINSREFEPESRESTAKEFRKPMLTEIPEKTTDLDGPEPRKSEKIREITPEATEITGLGAAIKPFATGDFRQKWSSRSISRVRALADFLLERR